jgi:cytochrome c
MRIRAAFCMGISVMALVGSTMASTAGDAVAGAGVFSSRCKECHEAPPDSRKAGPSLVGVVGRLAGSLAGFNYSDAMRSAGFIWSEEQLRAYVLNPKALVPKNRMRFNGIKREGEVDDLIAYLKSISS